MPSALIFTDPFYLKIPFWQKAKLFNTQTLEYSVSKAFNEDNVQALGDVCRLIALADPEQRIYDWIGAVELGIWSWIGFVAPAMLGQVLWEQKPFSLYLINAGYWLVSFIAMAIVLLF